MHRIYINIIARISKSIRLPKTQEYEHKLSINYCMKTTYKVNDVYMLQCSLSMCRHIFLNDIYVMLWNSFTSTRNRYKLHRHVNIFLHAFLINSYYFFSLSSQFGVIHQTNKLGQNYTFITTKDPNLNI